VIGDDPNLQQLAGGDASTRLMLSATRSRALLGFRTYRALGVALQGPASSGASIPRLKLKLEVTLVRRQVSFDSIRCVHPTVNLTSDSSPTTQSTRGLETHRISTPASILLSSILSEELELIRAAPCLCRT
jgi:hypothetical protein